MELKKTRNELLRTMPYEEFLDWYALYRIRPFGEDIEDLRIGYVCSTVHNNAMGQTTLKKPRDFMPFDRYRKEETLVDKVKAWQKSYTVKHGRHNHNKYSDKR